MSVMTRIETACTQRVGVQLPRALHRLLKNTDLVREAVNCNAVLAAGYC